MFAFLRNLLRKKRDKFISKEYDIYNHLAKLFELMSRYWKLLGEKDRLLELWNDYLKQKNIISIASKNGQFDAETITHISSTLQEFKKSMLLKIKEQKNLLFEDVALSRDSEELGIQIRNMPLFQLLNHHEEQILKIFVQQETAAIIKLFDEFKLLSAQLRKEEGLIKNINQDNQIHANFNAFIMALMPQNKLLWQLLYDEGGIYCKIKEILKNLENRLLVIADKYLEFSIHPSDFQEVQQAAGNLLNLQEKKTAFIKSYLREQRRIRQMVQLNQLIAIHATNSFPENGVIKPTGEYEPLSNRHTIHFALNGYVGSHGWDFSGRKYVILIPLKDIIDRVVSLQPHDTWVLGKLRLPSSSEIIGGIEDLDGHDPGKARLVFKEKHESMEKTTEKRIIDRGYSPIVIGGWSWNEFINEEDKKKFENIFGSGIDSLDLKNLYQELEKKPINHGLSIFSSLEKTGKECNMVKYPRRNPTNRDIKEVTDSINELQNWLRELDSEVVRLRLVSEEEKEAISKIKTYILKLVEGLNRLLDNYKLKISMQKRKQKKR